MALPADFSKIYGSTATGGLTPISDVNYAKGWEFVGSNPPTKNDFSYLQNLSDLKSQWLYSNKLQRANPFGDIKSDGAAAISTALTNLGLTDTIQLAANALPKTGTAKATEKLATPRKINGKSFDGTADITIPTSLNQSWSDVSSSRVGSTLYTNTLGNTLFVSVYTKAVTTTSVVSITGFVNGVQVYGTGVGGENATKQLSCILIVPPGATYSVSTSVATIDKWLELS